MHIGLAIDVSEIDLLYNKYYGFFIRNVCSMDYMHVPVSLTGQDRPCSLLFSVIKNSESRGFNVKNRNWVELDILELSPDQVRRVMYKGYVQRTFFCISLY